MKKFIPVLLLMTGALFAGEPTEFSPIYVSSQATNNVITQPRLVTLNQAPAGSRNCITDISASADKFPAAGYSLYILDGNTTAYALGVTTSPLSYTFYKGNPLCLGNGATTYVYISTGDWKMNINGYQK